MSRCQVSQVCHSHYFRLSDEQLKQAITKLEDALTSLRELTSDREGEEPDVEAHGAWLSDENVKQAIAKLEDALEKLRKATEQTEAEPKR